MTKNKFKIILGATAAICLIAVAIVTVLLLVQGGGRKYDKHMELAAQYLEDMEYEKAIAELRTAIDVDPKNREVYLELADVYVKMGDYESAIAVLEEGIEEAGGRKLEKGLAEVREAYERMQKNLATAGINEEGAVLFDDKNIQLMKYNEFEDMCWELDLCASGEYVVYEYDENGNISEKNIFGCGIFDVGGGEISQHIVYEYDDQGYRVKEICYDVNDNAIYWGKIEYEDYGKKVTTTYDGDLSKNYEGDMCKITRQYDDNGNLLREVRVFPDGISAIDVHEYDDDGRRLKTFCYVGENNEIDGFVQYIFTYEYDGNMHRELRYLFGKDLTDMTESEYDESGNRIRSVSYTYRYDDDSLLPYTETQYNYSEDGFERKVISYDCNGEKDEFYWIEEHDRKGYIISETVYSDSFVTVTEYSDKGYKAKSTTYMDGVLQWTEEFDIKEWGNVKKTTSYSLDGKINDMYEHKYDIHGNLVSEKYIRFNLDGTINFINEFNY